MKTIWQLMTTTKRRNAIKLTLPLTTALLMTTVWSSAIPLLLLQAQTSQKSANSMPTLSSLAKQASMSVLGFANSMTTTLSSASKIHA